MAAEILLVSVVFWAAVLILYVLLDRRLARLTTLMADLDWKHGKP